MVGGAAAFVAEDAEAVGVVHDEEAILFLGGGDDFGNGRDVALHGVNAFEGDDLGGFGGLVGKEFAEVGGVVVGEAFGAGLGQANAGPNGGVEVFVAEDDVAFLGEGLDGRHAGDVAGDGDVAGFLADEGGEFFLEALVVGAAAVGEAGAGGAGAPFGEGALAGGDDFGMVGEAEVIIAAEHDHLAPIEPHMGADLAIESVIIGLIAKAEAGGLVLAAAIGDGIAGLGGEQ